MVVVGGYRDWECCWMLLLLMPFVFFQVWIMLLDVVVVLFVVVECCCCWMTTFPPLCLSDSFPFPARVPNTCVFPSPCVSLLFMTS